ncbi:Sodium- And Chloride-Dependent Glycine Transporter 1 [Manis pentadactyla]|nr:Sodium- And Chloride-Dependent Glycine Transporter 1 [Manis pentadactyla]
MLDPVGKTTSKAIGAYPVQHQSFLPGHCGRDKSNSESESEGSCEWHVTAEASETILLDVSGKESQRAIWSLPGTLTDVDFLEEPLGRVTSDSHVPQGSQPEIAQHNVFIGLEYNVQRDADEIAAICRITTAVIFFSE